MKKLLFALGTLIFFVAGIGFLVFGFTGSPIETFLDRVYWPLVAICLATQIAYIVDALRNARVPASKRQLWAVVLFLGHFFAQPFYYWFYVARGDRSRT